MPKFPLWASAKGAAASIPSHREMAREFYAPLIPLALELQARGLSLGAIAREFTARAIPTRQGFTTWRRTQVRRLLLRAASQ